MSAFFEAVPVGSVHHMVCTWGESARCGDVRGADNFAKLQKQMAIKFDLQMRPVSMGADKARSVPYALISLHLSCIYLSLHRINAQTLVTPSVSSPTEVA
jgi:hypothetical protein